MEKLAKAGGGKAYRMEELSRVLQDLKKQPLVQGQRPKTELYPDWCRSQTTAFLPGYLLAFAGLLGLEWFLRARGDWCKSHYEEHRPCTVARIKEATGQNEEREGGSAIFS